MVQRIDELKAGQDGLSKQATRLEGDKRHLREEVKRQWDECMSQLDTLQDAADAAKQADDQRGIEVAHQLAELRQDLNSAVTEAQQRCTVLERQVNAFGGKVEQVDAALKRKGDSSEVEKLKAWTATADASLHEMNSTLGKVSGGVKRELHELSSKVEMGEQSRQELRACVDALTSEDLKSKVASLSDEKDQLRSEVANVQAQNGELRAQVASLSGEKDQLRSEVGALTRSCSELQEKFDAMNTAHASKVSTLEDELKQLRAVTAKARFDLSGEQMPASGCYVSKPFVLAGIKMRFDLYPQGYSGASPGHCSFFLATYEPIWPKIRVTLDGTTKTYKSVGGYGFCWPDFGPAATSFESLELEVLEVRRHPAP